MGCETFLFVCVCCSVFNRACDHAPQGSVYDRGGALQEQALFEVPKDNQAGNPHILSPGLVYRPLEKHGKNNSTDTCGSNSTTLIKKNYRPMHSRLRFSDHLWRYAAMFSCILLYLDLKNKTALQMLQSKDMHSAY